MDGVQVTTVVSVVGGVVGLIAVTVAWSQMKIASAKVKLDLYNKRFGVYVAALEFYQCTGTTTEEDMKEKFNKLTQAYRESKFIFDEKDEIHETLGRMQKAGVEIRTFHECKLDPESNATMVKIFYEKYVDALTAMDKDLLLLEGQLKSYLSFHKVGGWGFRG
ncbi:hypothetical protein D3C80_933670 [compost metagenome]